MASFGLDDAALGGILVAMNCAILVATAVWIYLRRRRDH
jgi:formate/nitrite transporter FocA (FNT family)